MDKRQKDFLSCVNKLHDVTEDFEIKDNVQPFIVVQSLAAVAAKFAASQPDVEKATESFINYFRSCIARIIESDRHPKQHKKQSEF